MQVGLRAKEGPGSDESVGPETARLAGFLLQTNSEVNSRIGREITWQI